MATGFKDTAKQYYTLEQFKGVDTKSGRTVISQDEFSWIENAQPIGNGNMRAVPGPTQLNGAIWSATPTASFLSNINNQASIVVFENNGGAESYNVSTGVKTTVAAAGTFSGAGVQAVMWKNTHLLIVDPSKGYFAWNGTNLVQIGSVGLITVTNGGSGYTSVPTVTFSAPNQAGGIQATGIASISGGAVSSITLTNPGTGYTSAPTITFSGGGGSGATATAQLISQPGTSIAVFAGRVWIAQGRTIYFTAANTHNDFISVSAGNVTITDSVLFGNITALLSANSYLYIFGADSINIISDISVTSTGTTVFTNTNISSSVGTTFQNAIFPYFRSVLFMNNYGVYALVGATTTKISDPLDGVFPLIDFTQPVYASQFVINSTLCAVFGFTYKDPVQGPRYLMAVFFDKKWWFASQVPATLHILGIPSNAGITLYSVTPNGAWSLFSNSNAPVLTTIQTPLISFKNPVQDKQLLKLGVQATNLTSTLNVVVENEFRETFNLTYNPSTISWINNAGAVIPWTNNIGQTVNWTGSGYSLYQSDASQYGKYIGFTMTLQDSSFILNGLIMQYEMRATF